jgi:hypothetical protein
MSEENYESMDLITDVASKVGKKFKVIPAKVSSIEKKPIGAVINEPKSRFVNAREMKTEGRGIALLRDMYEIFSPSGGEHAISVFITNWLIANGITPLMDSEGNIYAQNDVRGSKRIIINAHMDTVASAPAIIKVVRTKKDAILSSTNNQVIGADDKNGVWCVLRLLTDPEIDTPLTALICVSEESGCNGSQFAMDNHADYFDDCVFNITVDRRGNTDIINENFDITLCSNEMTDILNKWGKPWGLATTQGSISDASNIVEHLKINGINLFAGYYNAHMGTEYTSMTELLKSYQFQKEILPKLHAHFMKNPKSVKFTDFNRITYPITSAYCAYDNAHFAGGRSTVYTSAGTGKPHRTTRSSRGHSEASVMDAFEEAIDDIDNALGSNLIYYDFIDADYELSHSGKSLKILRAFELYPSSVATLEYYFTVSSNAARDAIIPIEQIMGYKTGQIIKGHLSNKDISSIDGYDYSY